MLFKKQFAIILYALVFATLPKLAIAQAVSADSPEARTSWQQKAAVWSKRQIVVAANPLAAKAGQEILRIGGSAVDAAIATQLVLALVEPQSSGLGGGAMMLVFDEATQRVRAYDGRETAPYAVTEKLFLQDGAPLDFEQAVIGGRSVGVPGLMRVLQLAHQQHGKLPWARLFQPAIRLAEKGFIISPRLASLLAQAPRLYDDAQARAYFYDSAGKVKTAGMRLRNPLLAKTLRKLANDGADIFYRGEFAQNIVDVVNQHPTNPGRLALKDFLDYRAKEREAVCQPFRQWLVCGMPLPSSGGISVAQILGILAVNPPLRYLHQNFQDDVMSDKGGAIPQWRIEQAHRFTEAGRLAFADRDYYLADDDFVPLPVSGWRKMLDPEYLKQRAALIGQNSMGLAQPGNPFQDDLKLSSQTPDEILSTTHMSIVDAYGQAISMTSSIEMGFGAHIMTDGFLLNNQLTDFSFIPEKNGKLIANRVQPGKRPRSSMAPTIVLENGRLKMLVGSPGGPNIINYVAKVIAATLDWGYSLPQAINMANIGSRNGPTELESNMISPSLLDALQERGHNIKVRDMNSGIHAIMRIDLSAPVMGVDDGDTKQIADKTFAQHSEQAHSRADASALRDSPTTVPQALTASGKNQTMPAMPHHFIWQGAADPRREGIALAD